MGASSLKTPTHHSARSLEVAAGPMSSLQTSPCARGWSPEPPSEHLQTAAVYRVWKPSMGSGSPTSGLLQPSLS